MLIAHDSACPCAYVVCMFTKHVRQLYSRELGDAAVALAQLLVQHGKPRRRSLGRPCTPTSASLRGSFALHQVPLTCLQIPVDAF